MTCCQIPFQFIDFIFIGKRFKDRNREETFQKRHFYLFAFHNNFFNFPKSIIRYFFTIIKVKKCFTKMLPFLSYQYLKIDPNLNVNQ